MTASDPQPSLREAQARATQDRILDALADLLVEAHPATISVPEVAKRAGVGVATVYRHFPKKADLFDRYALRNSESVPETADMGDPPTALRAIAANFAKREAYHRAERHGPVVEDIRRRRRTEVAQRWFTAIDARLPGLAPTERDRLCRTLAGLFTPATYLSLRDHGDLSPDEAVDALASAVEAVFAAAADDRPTDRTPQPRPEPGESR